MRIGGVECNAQKLNQLGSHHSAGVDPSASGHEAVGPDGIELEKPVPRFIPLANGAYFIDSRCCGGSFLRCLYSGGLGLLQKDGGPQTARVYRQHRGHLQHQQDLFAAGARFERSPDVTACPLRIEVGAGCVKRDADQFHGLARQDTGTPGVGGHSRAGICPLWIPFPKRRQSAIPWAGLAGESNRGIRGLIDSACHVRVTSFFEMRCSVVERVANRLDWLFDFDEYSSVGHFRRIRRDSKATRRYLSGCHVVSEAMSTASKDFSL